MRVKSRYAVPTRYCEAVLTVSRHDALGYSQNHLAVANGYEVTRRKSDKDCSRIVVTTVFHGLCRCGRL